MPPKEATFVRAAGRDIAVTNPNKIYWPDDGIPKGELIEYYTKIAPLILPYLKDRPLVLTRYPEGINGKWFYSKNAPDNRPDWLRTYTFVHKDAGPIAYLLADEPAALTFIANMGAIEIHPWTGRTHAPENPDFAIIDLDPADGATWSDTRAVALMVKQLLDAVGIQGLPKWSGATGIHIYCPCLPDHTYDDTAAFCAAIGRLLARVNPQRVTIERMVKKRTGKVYIDYLQNRLGQTISAVYGVRPRPGAPVSIPITWQEIAADAMPRVGIREIWGRIRQVGDLFTPVLHLRQDLRQATAALAGVQPAEVR